MVVRAVLFCQKLVCTLNNFLLFQSTMQVIKRDGRKQRVLLDKITYRIENLSYNLDRNFVDPVGATAQFLWAV